MIEWINFVIMVASTALFFYFYVKSAGPAKLALKIGDSAYGKCGKYRIIAMIFEFVVTANYIIYRFYPLPFPADFPEYFNWDWSISVIIATIIAIPSGFLMVKGMLVAGSESLVPDKEQKLYSGIYNKIRHPQATGEVFLWWIIAFLFHSPFLAIYSLIFLPVFYWMCIAEENDLVIRFGKDYEDYMERTGRFFPVIRKKE